MRSIYSATFSDVGFYDFGKVILKPLYECDLLFIARFSNVTPKNSPRQRVSKYSSSFQDGRAKQSEPSRSENRGESRVNF